LKDIAYSKIPYKYSELKHSYGSQVHLASNPLQLSLLAKLSSIDTKQPLINNLVRKMYSALLNDVINSIFPKKHVAIKTRMNPSHPREGVYSGEIISPETNIVCVDLARAGMLPSFQIYDDLNYIVGPDLVRQDHIYIGRTVNDEEKVTGAKMHGSKIGGPIDEAIVLIPDPMGATGTTLIQVIDHYKKNVPGIPLKFVAMHLIVTPEYMKAVTKAHPDVEIFALRIDRGLSSDKVKNSPLGKFIDEEKGLNSHQYIVPGAGGVGEILNNSFV
jgi:uracil phosphoribosyltransferase